MFMMIVGLAILPDLPLPVQPILRDLDRFPNYEISQINHALACNHVHWLEATITAFPTITTEYNYGEWLEEARAHRRVWEDLRDCHWHTSPVSKLNRLKRLHRALGNNYWIGKMPPPVPIWRFQME